MSTWREGGCHCGAIRFRVYSDLKSATLCNCSICVKKGFLHLIVPKTEFELLQGEDALSLYTFNTKTAQHYFCKICGVAPYYIPRSHPDGFDVNLRCVDDVDLSSVEMERFDGQNWEKNIGEIEGFHS